MSKPLGYNPPLPPDTAASDEVDDLVQALHDSGLLRALAGGARAYPDLLTTLLKSVDADTVRSTLALAGSLRDLDPEESQKVADGIRRARTDAAAAAAARPEGAWALFKRIKDPDTRRGISAALAALSALGGSLPR